MKIHEEVSTILKVHVPEGKYRQIYQRLNASGVVSQKQRDELLFLLLERVDRLEQQPRLDLVSMTEDIDHGIERYFDRLIQDTSAQITGEKTESEPVVGSLERKPGRPKKHVD